MEKHLQQPSAERDRLVSFAEALKTLGISKSNAYRLLERGALPQPIKIGHRSFFSERELQEWITKKLAARVQEGCHAVQPLADRAQSEPDRGGQS